MTNYKILLVDDDTAFRKRMEEFFCSQGYKNVRSACCGEIAIEMVKKELPDVVLLDMYLPEMSGLKAIREIHKVNEKIPVFVLSCETDDEHRHLAMKLGAADYLTKPITMMNLLAYLETRLNTPGLPPAAAA
jgi:DNA-binding response OmpR family regulator